MIAPRSAHIPAGEPLDKLSQNRIVQLEVVEDLKKRGNQGFHAVDELGLEVVDGGLVAAVRCPARSFVSRSFPTRPGACVIMPYRR